MAGKKDSDPGWFGIRAKKEERSAEPQQGIEEELDMPQRTHQKEFSYSQVQKAGYSPNNLSIFGFIFLIIVASGVIGFFLMRGYSDETTAKSVEGAQPGSSVVNVTENEQAHLDPSKADAKEVAASPVVEVADEPVVKNGTSQKSAVEEPPQLSAELKQNELAESGIPQKDQTQEAAPQTEGSIVESDAPGEPTEKNSNTNTGDEQQTVTVDPEQPAKANEVSSNDNISNESLPPTMDNSTPVEPTTQRTTVVETERHPLLMEGKKTLYQRVLTRPGALLNSGSKKGENGGEVWGKIDPFSMFFVFDRKAQMGSNWVEVGLSTSGPTVGWIDARQLIDWKQTLTLAFTNPVGREPTLLFRDEDSLIDLVDASNVGVRSEALRQTIQQGDIPEDFPVISIEPATHIDIRDQFYLLPILDAKEVFLSSGFNVRALKIASVTLDEGEQDLIVKEENRKSLVQEVPKQEQVMEKFKAGVVFVIDSTTSMGPYIDKTREAVRQIYDNLKNADLLGQVSFGLVAYRDNFDNKPKLGYLSHVFGNLKDGESPDVLLKKISVVEPATVSSQGFVEDAFAGIRSAIEDMNWSEYDGRYIILITDAGARTGNDPLSSTRMNAEQIRRLALDKGIATYCLHILSATGKKNHESAEMQYRSLSEYPAAGSLYYPVEDGSVQEFGYVTEMLASAFVDQVIDASKGYVARETTNTPSNEKDTASSDHGENSQNSGESETIVEIREKTLLVGRASTLIRIDPPVLT